MFNTEFQIVLLSAVFICCHAAVICISLVSETDSVFSASQYVTSYILSVRSVSLSTNVRPRKTLLKMHSLNNSQKDMVIIITMTCLSHYHYWNCYDSTSLLNTTVHN